MPSNNSKYSQEITEENTGCLHMLKKKGLLRRRKYTTIGLHNAEKHFGLLLF